jgi:hypothetical protein
VTLGNIIVITGRVTRKDKRISYDERSVEEKKEYFVKFSLLNNLGLEL